MHTNQISHLPIHKFTEMDQIQTRKSKIKQRLVQVEKGRGTDFLGRKEGYVRIRLTGHS